MDGGRRDSKTEPKSADKHIVIQEAYSRMDTAIDNLDNFVARVKGTYNEKGGRDKNIEIPLCVFLQDSSSIISNKTDRIGKLVEELRELLF